MSSPRSEEYDPKQEEPVIFTSSDKNSVLKIAHSDLLPMILHAVSTTSAINIKAMTFEDVIDSSPALLDDYRSLRAFVEIKNLKAHKDRIQTIIRDYVNQVLAGCRMANDQGFAAFRASVKSAIGLSALFTLYGQIQASKKYPSSLEIPDVAPDMLITIRALDIFQHLPADMMDTNILGRNTAIFLHDQMKALKANPEKIFAAANQAAPAAPKQQPKSAPAPKQKPAAHTAKNPDPDEVFAQFFGRGNSFFSAANPAASNPIGQINAQMQQMDNYAKSMQSQTADMLRHNKASNCNLFFGIANGVGLEKIREYLTKSRDYAAIKDGYGNNALHLAALSGRTDVVNLLLGDFDVDGKNADGNSPLHLAVLSGNADTVQALVRAGASVTQDNNQKMDPWLLAMHAKNEGITMILTRSRSFNPMKTY